MKGGLSNGFKSSCCSLQFAERMFFPVFIPHPKSPILTLVFVILSALLRVPGISSLLSCQLPRAQVLLATAATRYIRGSQPQLSTFNCISHPQLPIDIYFLVDHHSRCHRLTVRTKIFMVWKGDTKAATDDLLHLTLYAR
jgi:hypothetical protein